ncbi:MAG: hypothetical protein RL087_1894, partial [Pseudomonadota bacterium]
MARHDPAGTPVKRPTARPSHHSPDAPAERVSGALVWLRRDLRADDHAALHHALRTARRVW